MNNMKDFWSLDTLTLVFYSSRNNGFAISTPAKDQYRGDGIASRAHGYGMPAIRVDGNDVLAVYNATKAARDLALSQSRPVMVEAMTYRVGHHSTSDDSSAYRSRREVDAWKRYDSPITRFRQYLEAEPHQAWNEEQDAALRSQARSEILAEFTSAEKRLRPPIEFLFDDVFAKIEGKLPEQAKENEELVAKLVFSGAELSCLLKYFLADNLTLSHYRYPEFYMPQKFATKEHAVAARKEIGYPR